MAPETWTPDVYKRQKHHIYTEEEIRSRYDILLENYVKTIAIEARTMVDILSRDFLPALLSYTCLLYTS